MGVLESLDGITPGGEVGTQGGEEKARIPPCEGLASGVRDLLASLPLPRPPAAGNPASYLQIKLCLPFSVVRP